MIDLFHWWKGGTTEMKLLLVDIYVDVCPLHLSHHICNYTKAHKKLNIVTEMAWENHSNVPWVAEKSNRGFVTRIRVEQCKDAVSRGHFRPSLFITPRGITFRRQIEMTIVQPVPQSNTYTMGGSVSWQSLGESVASSLLTPLALLEAIINTTCYLLHGTQQLDEVKRIRVFFQHLFLKSLLFHGCNVRVILTTIFMFYAMKTDTRYC